MATFVFRPQAAAEAKRQGYRAFRTEQHPTDRVWKLYYEPGEDVAGDEWRAKDYVAWTETRWEGGGRKVATIVVSCFEHEIPEEDKATAKALGWTFEPQVNELWHPDKPADVRRTRAKGDGAEGTSQRPRSDVESPVKVVWRIADEMKGKPRSEVIAACIEAGVNKATASTQFYRWQKAQTA